MILNRVIPAKARVLILALLFLLPLLYVVKQYDRETGFTSLILFGPAYDAQALDEVRNIPHPLIGVDGYDGQFYAQIAIDPTLRNPQLKTALDNPRYRSVRILLPALAHLLGLGQPAAVLNAYALLNLGFFLLLLWGFVYFLKPRTIAHFLCLAAAAWSTGALASVARALTDLPTAALAFLAAGMTGAGAFPVFAAAVLCRESMILGFFAPVWPRTWTRRELGRVLPGAFVIILPLAAWMLYVDHVFRGTGTPTPATLSLPFTALAQHLHASCLAVWKTPNPHTLFMLLATFSLLVQIAYFFSKPRINSAFWRLGIPFAGLFFFFGASLFAEPLAFCRTTLPIPLAFNALLIVHPEKRFFAWYLTGNAGLAYGTLQMLHSLAG